MLSFTVVTFVLLSTSLFAFIFYTFYNFLVKKRAKCTEKDIESLQKIKTIKVVEPPSPRKLPIIGHLHLLAKYDLPFLAFNELKKKYGNVVKLQLGNVKCVIVNEEKNIREVLINKGHHFDSRPSFDRYQHLYSGNKDLSMEFCDWSKKQKKRRNLLKIHTFPKFFSLSYTEMDKLIVDESSKVIDEIVTDSPFDIKPLLLRRSANIFTRHFASESFNINDKEFVKMTENFDELFWELNQGYAADFLPFLMVFHRKNLRRLKTVTDEIREFVGKRLVKNRYRNHDWHTEPKDYLDSLIAHAKMESWKGENHVEEEWKNAVHSFEDVIGGHSAIANLLVKILAFLVNEPDVQRKMQEEIDSQIDPLENCVSIGKRKRMPYTEATIFEAIRLISSPIIPRVANQTTSIDGYNVEEGSLILMNNYELNMSEELWDCPEKFMPERFLKDGKLIKPEYFIPFGGGRRSCLGYKLVDLISFGVLGSIMKHFDIVPVENQNYQVAVGSLALKTNTYKFKFHRRVNKI